MSIRDIDVSTLSAAEIEAIEEEIVLKMKEEWRIVVGNRRYVSTIRNNPLIGRVMYDLAIVEVEKDLYRDMVRYWGVDSFAAWSYQVNLSSIDARLWPNWEDNVDSLRRYRAIAASLPERFKVVDIGCGTGMQQYFFKDHASYIGIDSGVPRFWAGPDFELQGVEGGDCGCELGPQVVFCGSLQEFVEAYPERTRDNNTLTICGEGADNATLRLALESFPNLLLIRQGAAGLVLDGRVVDPSSGPLSIEHAADLIARWFAVPPKQERDHE